MDLRILSYILTTNKAELRQTIIDEREAVLCQYLELKIRPAGQEWPGLAVLGFKRLEKH